MDEFIYLGGAGFVIALLLMLALGRSTRSAVAVAALGPVLVVAYLTLILAKSPDRPYHDESEHFGFWIDPVVFYILGFNLVGWLAGALAGFSARWLGSDRPTGAVRSS